MKGELKITRMLYLRSLNFDDEISCRCNLHNTELLCQLVICVPVSVFRDDNKEDIFVHQVIDSDVFHREKSLPVENC